LNEVVEKAHNRLTRLEAAAQRPYLPTVNEQDGGEKAAFFSYVRKGMEGIEQKSLTSLSDASGGYFNSAEYVRQNSFHYGCYLTYALLVESDEYFHGCFRIIARKGLCGCGLGGRNG